MPYIKQDQREDLEDGLNELIQTLKSYVPKGGDIRDLDGLVNYCITRILLETFDLTRAPKYTHFNTVHGILSSVDKEINRRFVVPYENLKIDQNGDIVSPFHIRRTRRNR